MTTLKPSKGKILVSEPSILNDKSFNRSVLYLSEYNEDGCIGFILNKPTDFVLNDLITEINCEFKIYNGGPVEQDNLYFIHRVPNLIPNSIEIDKELYWGGDFEILADLLNNNAIKPSEIRFFLGYSGWSINQLNDELNESTWAIVENNFPNILKLNCGDIWKNLMLKFGGEYQIWANAPKNPNLN